MIPFLKTGSPWSNESSYVPSSHLKFTLSPHTNQHAFRVKKSCLSQFLAHFKEILKGMEEGAHVDSIYFDLSKAFNKVDLGITKQEDEENRNPGKI